MVLDQPAVEEENRPGAHLPPYSPYGRRTPATTTTVRLFRFVFKRCCDQAGAPGAPHGGSSARFLNICCRTPLFNRLQSASPRLMSLFHSRRIHFNVKNYGKSIGESIN